MIGHFVRDSVAVVAAYATQEGTLQMDLAGFWTSEEVPYTGNT